MFVACCDQNEGNLDVALLEDDFTLLTADQRHPGFPLNLVERVGSCVRKDAWKLQTWLRGHRGGSRPPAGRSPLIHEQRLSACFNSF